MKILFCSNLTREARMGAAKHFIELQEGFSALGWDAQFAGCNEINGGFTTSLPAFHSAFRKYLDMHAAEFDVVEYPSELLPIKRSEFNSRTLFVAAIPLLHLHLREISIPNARGFNAWIGRCLYGSKRRQYLETVMRYELTTIENADLTVCSNDRDSALLRSQGISSDKLRVFPLGLNSSRMQAFASFPVGIPESATKNPVIAFVGSFEPRKGSVEFPELVKNIVRLVPGATFKLLGTVGRCRDVKAVHSFFPSYLRSRIEVHPTFDPQILPKLLSDCTAGVFPSHLEGFGYGVLEMLAAGLPVFAYDVPGPPMMLPPEYLIKRGDSLEMASKLSALLADPAKLAEARNWARKRSNDFSWEKTVASLSACFEHSVRKKLSNNDP